MRLELLHGVKMLKACTTSGVVIEEAQLGDNAMSFAHMCSFSRSVLACLLAKHAAEASCFRSVSYLRMPPFSLH